MKQGRITIAFKAVCDLYVVKGLPFWLSSNLFTMKRRLQPYVEHQQEQEHEILEACDGLNQMTGEPVVTRENETFIASKFRDIRETEVEYDHPVMEIKLTDELVEKMGICGQTIDELDGFILFKVGDGE